MGRERRETPEQLLIAVRPGFLPLLALVAARALHFFSPVVTVPGGAMADTGA
jgi:hypothetical protein